MTTKQTAQTARQRRRTLGGSRKSRKHSARSQWRAQRKGDAS